MYPTISTEGSDTLDALSRSYNYVYQSPWQFIWLSIVAIFYGAVVIFFVGLMGSLTVYLGKWGMSNTPGIKSLDRSPDYLFVYAPTSYGWREMLLEGSPGGKLTALQDAELSLRRAAADNPQSEAATQSALKRIEKDKVVEAPEYNKWLGSFYWYNKLGAVLVSFWITLLFLMVLGFGYSFFWTTSTMIYLLMRRKVDDTDLDEVYLEEEESADMFGSPTGASTLPITPPPAEKKELVDLNIKTDKPALPPPAPPTTQEPAPEPPSATTPPPPPAS
jgi:hypothetical protein